MSAEATVETVDDRAVEGKESEYVLIDCAGVQERPTALGAPELVSDVHDGFMVLIPFPAQGLRWSPGELQPVPAASGSPSSQVSDVFISQSECDTAVDLVCSLRPPG